MESKNENTTTKESMPKDIMCVYSQSEEDKPFYVQLKKSLKLWEQQGWVRCMEEIRAGSEVSVTLSEQVKCADLILLLLSPDFFSNDDCDLAMSLALQKRTSHSVPVVPILIRDVNWQLSACKDLAVVPHNEQPIASWISRDEAYISICADLARLLPTWQLRLPTHLTLFQADYQHEEGYVPRLEVLRGIKSKLLEPRGSQTRASVTALRGAGGIGKTTLALAICHDPDIQVAFSDGILWIELGEHPPGALDLLNRLLVALERSHPMATTLREARAHWRIALRNRRCLLVVDDVWQTDALIPLLEDRSQCVWLVTTRNDLLLPEDTQRIWIDVMEPHEALAVLSHALPGEKQPTYQARLIALTERLGCWPLILKLANSMLVHLVNHHKSLEKALTAAEEAYQTRGVTAFRQDNAAARQRTVDSCMEVSIEYLKEFPFRQYNATDRYQELAIFPEDVDIPIATLEILWKGSAGLQRWETEDLCLRLYGLSLLLTCDLSKGTVRLHGVMRSYLVQRAETQMFALHARLLEAYWKVFGLKQWAGLPSNDRYIWQHLIRHLCRAGLIDTPPIALTDLGYLIRAALYAGVSSLETDLLLASACSSNPASFASLHRTVVRISHLLRQARTPAEMGGLLLSYLGWESTFKDQRQALERELPRPFLTAWHPLPDQSFFALLRILRGHTDSATNCAVSPDGRFIVSTSGDRTLKVWDATTGEERFVLSNHRSVVWNCAVSPDSRFIVSASNDCTLKVWDATTGTERRTLKGHKSDVFGCAVSPDSRFIVSASGDGTLKIWDMTTGMELQTLRGHTKGVYCCAVSPDGCSIISASLDKTLKVWDMTTGATLLMLSDHTDGVTGCAVSPDGRFIVSSSEDKTLKVWDATTGKVSHTLVGHNNWVRSCAVSPDSCFIVSAAWDSTLKVWDAVTGKERFTLSDHTDKVMGCAVSPDSRFIVSASGDRTLRIWEVAMGAEHQTLADQSTWVRDCAVSPDGRFIISASYDCLITIWDTATGMKRRTLSGHSKAVNGCAVAPNSRFIVSASEDFTLKVWETTTWKERFTLTDYAGSVNSCAVSPDGRFIVSASENGTLKVWDVARGKERQTLTGHSNWVRSCAVSPDSRFIVSASEDHTLKIWDVARGKVLHTLSGHILGVTGCAVSPDGRFIVSSSEDKTLKVWDITTGEAHLTLSGHTSLVKGCVVSPNSRYILSVSSDNTLKIWETQMGRCLLTFSVDAALTGCAFHPDGEHLVACGTQGVYFLRLIV